MAVNLSYENAVKVAMSKAQEELKISRNVLKEFWSVDPFKGSENSVIVSDRIETNDNIIASGANRNRGTPEVTDVAFRRRMSQKFGNNVAVTASRALAQRMGMSFEKLVELYSQKMVDAYNYDTLRDMIRGMTFLMRENAVFAGFGDGGGPKGGGRSISFPSTNFHLPVGAHQMTPKTYTAPFTLAALWDIDARMINCTDVTNVSSDAERAAITDPDSVYGTDGDRRVDLGPLHKRIVIIGATGWSHFRETNQAILGGSQGFTNPRKFLSHAYLYELQNFVFVVVPDELISYSGTPQYPVPTSWMHADQATVTGETRDGLSPFRTYTYGSGDTAVTFRSILPGVANMNVRLRVNGTQREINVRIGNTSVSTSILGGSVTINTINNNRFNTRFRIDGTDANLNSLFGDSANLDTYRTFADRAKLDDVLVNTAANHADVTDKMETAIIVDRRAMKYSYPSTLNTMLQRAKNFTKSQELQIYSEYYLDCTRIYDPLVRVVNFTRSGKNHGTYVSS